MENQTTVFSNAQMLNWMSYITEKMNVSPEKVKMMNICGKKKNVLPTIESHKRVLIFADESHKELLYEIWEAGLGDTEIWYGTGTEAGGELKHAYTKELISMNITEPMVLFVLNQNTRESYRIGIKNENFSKGTVKYVGSEIRAVIMNLLNVDDQDCICIVSGESIVIEASIAASEGTIIAVEGDPGSMTAMEENASKFGVHNVEIVENLEGDVLDKLPTPRLAFIVADKNLEKHMQALVKKNPEIQIIIYTLELDMLMLAKSLLEKYELPKPEIIQVSVSKTNSKGVFVAQPQPWLLVSDGR